MRRPDGSEGAEGLFVFFEEDFVQAEDVEDAFFQEIFDDHVAPDRIREGVAGAGEEGRGLFGGEAEGEAEGKDGVFSRVVVRVVADFGKELAVDVGAAVAAISNLSSLLSSYNIFPSLSNSAFSPSLSIILPSLNVI